MATAAQRRVGNLPAALTTFVGRRRESSATKRLLTKSRLVTLSGIGGVGKTRLALQVAGEVQRDFRDGAWLVELGALRDPELVPNAVAESFGLRDLAAHSPTDLLVDFVGSRDLLVLLDNCEHLVGATSELVDLLLRNCPGLRVLATSREPLDVGGEAVLRVPPLPVPAPHSPPTLQAMPSYEAATLFVERAQAVDPDFALKEDNRAAIARICHRLHGLPLAIELAAARVRVLSPEQILERLTDRYRLLTAGSRVAPSRLQTLRMSVDWSYELCTPQERRLWSWLSVFSGEFELDAVEGVCADAVSGDTLGLVGSLVDKSILIAERSGAVVRYRMLEMLRDYGREKLDEAGELTECRHRHLHWYRALVERAEADWVGPRQVEIIARLTRENRNLREALDFCVTGSGEAPTGVQMAKALYSFWFCKGMLDEGRRWFTRFLDASDEIPDPIRVAALCDASLFASMQEDFAAASELIARARSLARVLEDPYIDALVLHAAGRRAVYQGECTGAVELLEPALGQFRARPDLSLVIWTLGALGLVAGMCGDAERGTDYFEELLSIARRHGATTYQARAMFMLGLTLWRRGERERGAGLFAEALPLTPAVDDHFAGVGCLEAMAWVAADAGQGERGAVLSGAAEAMRRYMGVPPVVVPAMLDYHEQCRRQCRRLLGARAFEAAFSRGAALEFADAVELALSAGDGTERMRAKRGAPAASMRIAEPVAARAVLTRRERQVADLVARGLTNREIAETLVIAQRTAEGHVERVLAKLGFGSRTQIAAWVAEQRKESTSSTGASN
ncbi:ATP-binding protein [Rhodococcus spongiicola]|uniref:LuxR family transcriptional regulator n=1 Tax=Rhodococcus spongiicola TaxID=2487352 RepID=A0A438B515_9NOCA|nr:LuxR C-terminal-related transcriptional regulator [Rhodococcus spongiicola]RVW06076.1 LuxR family transcriptional regulator [Rhodococcus spongiicola]